MFQAATRDPWQAQDDKLRRFRTFFTPSQDDESAVARQVKDVLYTLSASKSAIFRRGLRLFGSDSNYQKRLERARGGRERARGQMQQIERPAQREVGDSQNPQFV